MKHFKSNSLLVISLLALSLLSSFGCKSSDMPFFSRSDKPQKSEAQVPSNTEASGNSQSTLNDLLKHLDQTVRDAKKAVDEITPTREQIQTSTTQELNKLHSFEYKVVNIQPEDSVEKLEARLKQLGEERWDCFDVQPRDKDLIMFCKRRPETYLRYIPRFFP